MKYLVILTPAAESDIASTFAYIRIRSPQNAARWLKALYKAIDGLGEFHGYGRAPESDWLDYELRQKIFKSHRIIYSVDDNRKTVFVHYVRHGARKALGEPIPDDLD